MATLRKLPSLSRRLLARHFGPVPVIGLEAEFTLYVNDVKRLPEEVFGRACGSRADITRIVHR